MNSNGRWVLGACSVLLCGGLVAARWHTRSATAGRGELEERITSAAVGLSFYPAGFEQVYRLKYSTRVATTTSQPLTSFELDGVLKLSRTPSVNNLLVRGRFNGALRTESSSREASPGPELEASAQHPFVLEFDPAGRFIRASGEKGTSAFVGRIWTALGEYLQAPVPKLLPTGEVSEHDASGDYWASYVNKGLRSFEKRKLRYQSLTAKPLQSFEVVSYDGEFGVGEGGELLSYTLAENVRALLGSGPLPGFEAVTTVSLSRTTALPTLLAQVNAPTVVVPFDAHDSEADQAAQDEALVNGMGIADALTKVQPFQRAQASKEESRQAGRAFASLTALLRRDPTALIAVRGNLKKGNPLNTTLLAALRDSSTPEGQKLLIEMSAADSPLGPEDRLEAARSLSRVGTPTTETVKALEGLRSDPTVGVQATYGLGTALHNLQRQNPDVATEVRSALTAQLSSASDPGSQAGVLTALGNAGDPNTLALIRSYVTSGSAAVRAAAAQALRRIPGSQSDALLAQLCADPAPNVRYSAIDAIAERDPAAVLVAAISALALTDSALQVRAKAVNLVAEWYPKDSALSATLHLVESNDTNADLRNVAKVALGQG